MIVGPTQSLSSGQFVYVAMSGYAPGDTLRVAFCATDAVGTIIADPVCAENNGTFTLNPKRVVVAADGTAAVRGADRLRPVGARRPTVAGRPPGAQRHGAVVDLL